MRVAHFVPRYPPALGGAEAYFARLSRYLARAGHDVTVFTSSAIALEAFWDSRAACTAPSVTQEDGLIVRRALDADPAAGQRRWTDRHFVFNSYKDAELGYAVTDHAAQSRTVTAGLAVITGTEDRQHAYVALSRGTDINTAYVFTHSPKAADPAPGPRPALELARYDRRATTPDGPAAPAATTPGEALAVLAGVLGRDGQQHSATQARHQALADVDQLAILLLDGAQDSDDPGL